MPDSDQKAEGAPAPLPTRRDPQAGRRPEHVAVGMFMFGARLGVQAGRVAILPWRAPMKSCLISGAWSCAVDPASAASTGTSRQPITSCPSAATVSASSCSSS